MMSEKQSNNAKMDRKALPTRLWIEPYDPERDC